MAQEAHAPYEAGSRHSDRSDGVLEDLTGMSLAGGKGVGARSEETKYKWKKKVWTKVRRSESLENGWKSVKTRWIEINKGDDDSP